MTDLREILVMSFGAVVSLAGLWLLFLRKEGAVNRIKVLGQEFELSTPALIVFIVGAGIFVLPFFGPLSGPKPPINEQVAQEPAQEPTPARENSAGDQPTIANDGNVNVPGSRNRDKPTWLKSNEIRGGDLGEEVSYYYTFLAGCALRVRFTFAQPSDELVVASEVRRDRVRSLG
jgi:hypothetical protein